MHSLCSASGEGRRASTTCAVVGTEFFAVMLCVTVATGVVDAQSGPQGSGAGGSQGPLDKQAISVLASTLTSACGNGTSVSRPSEYWASQSKTLGVRRQDGVLYVERVYITGHRDGVRTDRMGGSPKRYRVRPGDLLADPDGIDANNVLGGLGPQGSRISFSCQLPGCVSVDGLPENRLAFSVCPETRSDVIRAMQTIIQQAGGPRKPLR